METYLYKAKDLLRNKWVKGEMETESEERVKKFLTEKYLYPVSIKKKTAFNSNLWETGFLQKKIIMRDITFFCKQFSAMIQAGISIARGLEICTEQSSHITLKKHLINIYEEVNKGRTEAVKEEKIFPDLLISMIECGEASGNLDMALRRVVDHFDNQMVIDRKIKRALIYPAIVTVTTIAVFFLMMIFVIPNYVAMFEDIDVKLPLPTLIVIAVSNFFVAYWPVILIAITLAALVLTHLRKIPVGKKMADELLLIAPVFGALSRKRLTVSFATTMAMLVASGLPMLQAMQIVKKVLNNSVAEEEIDRALELLMYVFTLHDALRDTRIYPVIMFSMIHVGEETGVLDEMLLKVGNYFNEEVQMLVDTLITFIEPLLIFFIAVIIGGIMAAVILPTFTAALNII